MNTKKSSMPRAALLALGIPFALCGCVHRPPIPCTAPSDLMQPARQTDRERLDTILDQGEEGEDIGPPLYEFADDSAANAVQLNALQRLIRTSAPPAD
jgi:hypothetical protein